MKKQAFLLLLFFITIPGLLQAQEYRTALGVRLSPFWGVTVKHFIGDSQALEGILHSRWNALKITGLWEKHLQAFQEPGLMFYYGGGGHLGIAGDRYFDNRFYNDNRFIIGLDGIIGLEYTIPDPDVPLNFSVDLKPALDIVPLSEFRGFELAISVRYVFR